MGEPVQVVEKRVIATKLIMRSLCRAVHYKGKIETASSTLWRGKYI